MGNPFVTIVVYHVPWKTEKLEFLWTATPPEALQMTFLQLV